MVFLSRVAWRHVFRNVYRLIACIDPLIPTREFSPFTLPPFRKLNSTVITSNCGRSCLFSTSKTYGSSCAASFCEVSTGLAQQFENWSPGQIRTRFVVNLARARGEFDDKVTFAKTHLGSRSQDAAFLTTEVLGVGSFGEVKCVLHKDSGKEYALKTVVEVSRMSSRLIGVLVSISGTRGQETEANENNGGLRVERGALSPGRVFLLTTDKAADVCCQSPARFAERDRYLLRYILGKFQVARRFHRFAIRNADAADRP